MPHWGGGGQAKITKSVVLQQIFIQKALSENRKVPNIFITLTATTTKH